MRHGTVKLKKKRGENYRGLNGYVTERWAVRSQWHVAVAVSFTSKMDSKQKTIFLVASLNRLHAHLGTLGGC